MTRITDDVFARFEQAFSDNAGLLGSSRRRAALEAIDAELCKPFELTEEERIAFEGIVGPSKAGAVISTLRNALERALKGQP